jgi:hypothetical protein
MLNNNFNFHSPWDSQNPYNLRLNKKQALWASSKKKKIHYNILSAYEVKDETSTSITYVSLRASAAMPSKFDWLKFYICF